MKTPKLVALLSVSLITMSYTPPDASIRPAMQPGTYSGCGCDPTAADSRTIASVINEDHTFHYVNGADPKATVDVAGTWEVVGNTVSLRTQASPGTVLEKWTVDKGTNWLRSRKGLLLTRFCHLQGCE